VKGVHCLEVWHWMRHAVLVNRHATLKRTSFTPGRSCMAHSPQTGASHRQEYAHVFSVDSAVRHAVRSPCVSPCHPPALLRFPCAQAGSLLNRRYEPRYWSKATADQRAPSPSASRTMTVAQAGMTSSCWPTARSGWTRAWRSFERASLQRSRRAGACSWVQEDEQHQGRVCALLGAQSQTWVASTAYSITS